MRLSLPTTHTQVDFKIPDKRKFSSSSELMSLEDETVNYSWKPLSLPLLSLCLCFSLSLSVCLDPFINNKKQNFVFCPRILDIFFHIVSFASKVRQGFFLNFQMILSVCNVSVFWVLRKPVFSLSALSLASNGHSCIWNPGPKKNCHGKTFWRCLRRRKTHV